MALSGMLQLIAHDTRILGRVHLIYFITAGALLAKSRQSVE
jgi:hypothetical protein